jgi:hypothetical protein
MLIVIWISVQKEAKERESLVCNMNYVLRIDDNYFDSCII